MRVTAWRNNVGAVSATYKGKTRFVRFGTPGLSDVIGLVPGTGQLFACELKSSTGKVSPAQQAFLDQVNAGGGLGFVARSVEEVRQRLGLAPQPTFGGQSISWETARRISADGP